MSWSGETANAQQSGSAFEEKLKHAFLNSSNVQSCFGDMNHHVQIKQFLLAFTAQGLMNHFKRLVLQDPDFQAQVIDKVARRFEANQVNIKSIVLYFVMAHDAASIFGAHQRNPRW